MGTASVTPLDGSIQDAVGLCDIITNKGDRYQCDSGATKWIHTDAVYNALLNAASVMESRLNDSLKTYQEHPDVQANLQQLQYDLQSWNLALTTMTNIQKNMADALSSIANNFK